ncbi:hypothetical protein COBT_001801, partial [Conglomerata obtusa]
MGNITEKCCSNITCRILIIGPDTKGKKKIYEKLTGTRIDENIINHYEEKISLFNVRMMICNPVGAEDIPNATKTQAEHSDGVIYVVNYEDKDNFDKAMDDFKFHYDSLCNKSHVKILILINRAINVNAE